ncbi:HK97 family phage prohead protease [Siccirubricoccus sp. KC 17139]|uniref:HK97 family phage prohead protease n=1 Tax=Siccirubricoccus soli TaxID=2899147 RepID=A0ABT1CYS1_9PROT|nr:HK97 family phage prohead protease [Siccirubricoccus soli]MCO6414807.1 HK97 family phage prohead protease [Siccirubricoccus soli]MCP2680937.1 HK97 family phage prohead protease [Siccirubricoccus soli]
MNITYLSNKDFKRQGKIDKSLVQRAPLTKASSSPAIPMEGRQIKFVLSAPTIDRDFDIFYPEGIDLTYYRTNPVVLWGHDSDQFPIGKCVSIGIEDGVLVGVVEFADPSIPIIGDRAEAVYQACRAGILNAVSIGAIVKEWDFAVDADRRSMDGVDVTACELIEFSVVTVPCNRQALIHSMPAAPEASEQPAPEPEADKAAPAPAKKHQARMLRKLFLVD